MLCHGQPDYLISSSCPCIYGYVPSHQPLPEEDQMREKFSAILGMFFYPVVIVIFMAVLSCCDYLLKKNPENIGVTLLPSPSAAMVIPVTVDGRQLKFQVDTGSRRTILINPSLAFISSEDDCTLTGGIKGASIRCYHSTLHQINVGKIVARDVHVLIVPRTGTNFEEEIDGILGLDFMRNYTVIFNKNNFTLLEKEE